MTIREIVEQLQACHYECEAGLLDDNVAFIALVEMAHGGQHEGALLGDSAWLPAWGWECPRCHAINSPLAAQCTCKPPVFGATK